MQDLIPILIMAYFVYIIFSRKGGGMGCCGGHTAQDPGRHDDTNRSSEKTIHYNRDEVIDLREDEFTVISSEDNKLPKA